ncbi:MAG: alcohol dehydrogenase catalytic domain-containing protein [Halolamina sp.]
MRAAVLREYGEPLDLTDRPRPEVAPDGALVAVDACGVCRSDWHAWQGHGEWADDRVPTGQVLGHEPAGEVVAVGAAVDHLREGDHVVVPFNLGCGTCRRCRNGHGNVCANGLALGFEPDAPGAFAEYVHVPAADYNATVLPDGVATEDVAALGCRYMTAYHALAHRGDVGPGDRVAVHGCGGVGLSAVQLATAMGARVVAVDVDDDALAAATAVGADATVDATDEDVPAAVDAATDGGATVSMDALGRAETCRNSVDCLRARGTHLQVGMTTDAERGEVSLPTDEIVRWDVDVLGSRGMPPTRYHELLALVESGRVDPGELVGREVSLAAVPDRLAAMTDYETEGVEVVTEF